MGSARVPFSHLEYIRNSYAEVPLGSVSMGEFMASMRDLVGSRSIHSGLKQGSWFLDQSLIYLG